MFITFLCTVIAISLNPESKPTAWHRDHATACAELMSHDKPLFIIICSGSCEYSQMASLGFFFSEALEKKLQTDYVRLLVDTDTVSGKELAKRFEAGDAPHFVILDRSGRWQVYYKSGYLLEEELAQVLAKFKRVKMTANGTAIRQVAGYSVARACGT